MLRISNTSLSSILPLDTDIHYRKHLLLLSPHISEFNFRFRFYPIIKKEIEPSHAGKAGTSSPFSFCLSMCNEFTTSKNY